jgi:hypothetical protein
MTRYCAISQGAGRRLAVCNDVVATAEHVGLRRFDIADRNRSLHVASGRRRRWEILGPVRLRPGRTITRIRISAFFNNKHHLRDWPDSSPNDQFTGGMSPTTSTTTGWEVALYQRGTSQCEFPNPAFDWSDGLTRSDPLAHRERGIHEGLTNAKFYYDFNKSTSTYSYVDVGLQC